MRQNNGADEHVHTQTDPRRDLGHPLSSELPALYLLPTGVVIESRAPHFDLVLFIGETQQSEPLFCRHHSTSQTEQVVQGK